MTDHASHTIRHSQRRLDALADGIAGALDDDGATTRHDRPRTRWPEADVCSECARPVRLAFAIEHDPLYLHADPTDRDHPERCAPHDEHRIATTALRDSTV